MGPNTEIPFVDLGAQYETIREEIDGAIQSVVSRSAFSGGTEQRDFETSFAAYLGVRYCVGVSSGTDALELSLRVLGVGAGDEVITVANTFFATCEAISLAGADVKFVDADPITYNIDPTLVEAAITERTKAIIPVHLYGQPADMKSILSVAQRYNLRVIEDAAQAHGATWNRKRVGSFGDVGCFSFYPSKNLGAYGDAGAVVTDNQELAEAVRMASNHGQRERYIHETVGACHRLDNLQAAVLNVKLRHLNSWNVSRQRVAALYDEGLADIPSVVTPVSAPGAYHVYHLYVVRVPRRDLVRERMAAKGIRTGIHYPVPCHEQPAYAASGFGPNDFPVSSQTAREVLSLPMYPELTEEQVTTIVAALRAAVAT